MVQNIRECVGIIDNFLLENKLHNCISEMNKYSITDYLNIKEYVKSFNLVLDHKPNEVEYEYWLYKPLCNDDSELLIDFIYRLSFNKSNNNNKITIILNKCKKYFTNSVFELNNKVVKEVEYEC